MGSVKDLGLTDSGSDVVQASSFDARYPPKCIVDGRMDTFWMATGMFPQQFVLKLPGLHVLDKVAIQAYNVKELCLERTNNEQPVKFETVSTITFKHHGGKLQTEELASRELTANYLRFRILSGYAPFVSVHRMSISGKETRTPISMDRPPSGEQGTRVIRNAPPATPPTGGLAPGATADRARSVSPAAMSVAPTENEFLDLPGDAGRPHSQPDPSRAASAAPSMFSGAQQYLDGAPPGAPVEDQRSEAGSVQGAFADNGMLPDSDGEAEPEPQTKPAADNDSVDWR